MESTFTYHLSQHSPLQIIFCRKVSTPAKNCDLWPKILLNPVYRNTRVDLIKPQCHVPFKIEDLIWYEDFSMIAKKSKTNSKIVRPCLNSGNI
jgi:hypothetical protein